jgi:hypothetical protein
LISRLDYLEWLALNWRNAEVRSAMFDVLRSRSSQGAVNAEAA